MNDNTLLSMMRALEDAGVRNFVVNNELWQRLTDIRDEQNAFVNERPTSGRLFHRDRRVLRVDDLTPNTLLSADEFQSEEPCLAPNGDTITSDFRQLTG